MSKKKSLKPMVSDTSDVETTLDTPGTSGKAVVVVDAEGGYVLIQPDGQTVKASVVEEGDGCVRLVFYWGGEGEPLRYYQLSAPLEMVKSGYVVE